MANRSVFPDSIDAFTELRDIQQAEVAEVKELKILRELASRTSEQDSRLNTLLIKYKNCIPSAELINLLQDAVANMESFYKYDIENGIITLKNQALAAIQDKLATINTYLDSTTAGALRTDIGVMANLPTTDKSSLVNAIVELFNGLAEPYVHPTTHSANIITISDAGNLIIATNAEEALQEIATKVNSYKLYTGVFNGTTGTIFTHTKGDLSYHVTITPTQNPSGYLGEVWVEYSALNFKVCCSGSATTSFSAKMEW